MEFSPKRKFKNSKSYDFQKILVLLKTARHWADNLVNRDA